MLVQVSSSYRLRVFVCPCTASYLVYTRTWGHVQAYILRTYIPGTMHKPLDHLNFSCYFFMRKSFSPAKSSHLYSPAFVASLCRQNFDRCQIHRLLKNWLFYALILCLYMLLLFPLGIYAFCSWYSIELLFQFQRNFANIFMNEFSQTSIKRLERWLNISALQYICTSIHVYVLHSQDALWRAHPLIHLVLRFVVIRATNNFFQWKFAANLLWCQFFVLVFFLFHSHSHRLFYGVCVRNFPDCFATMDTSVPPQ